MPRPKRQRPSWLPACVPFKDGRLCGLARQTILAWISAILALSFFSLTVSYALETSGLSHIKFVHDSRANTIMVLRVLSEAAAVFLAATIYSTFELVQWVLISRPEGIRFPQFLALQPGTGTLGLLVIALGKGLPPSEWPMQPRIMALLRLLVEFTVPLLGVLIMSNVSPDAVYVPIQETTQPFAFGMEPFNATIASQLGVMQDMLFNLNYVSFLSNPLHAIDLGGSNSAAKKCVKGVGLTSQDSCERHVMITQEFQNVEANLPLAKRLDSNVVVASNQQVYSMEYRDNIALSNDNVQCESYQSGPGAYRFCLRNAEDGSLHAAMIPCPADLVIKAGCTRNSSWHSDSGFTTSLHTSLLKATIAYDRQDGRILRHDIETKSEHINIKAVELLSALKVLLNTTTVPPNLNTTNPILGAPTHFFGRLVAGHMYRISKIMETNPSGRIKGINSLQSILGITLFFCQNGVLSQTVLPFAPKAEVTRNTYREGAFGEQNKTAIVSLAQTRYRIQIGRATLIAYIVMSGLTLLICIGALLVGTIIELARFDAEPTLWPALDFFTQCKVEHSSGKTVTAHDRVEMAWIYDGQDLLRKVKELKITRRKRKIRNQSEELELPGVVAEGTRS